MPHSAAREDTTALLSSSDASAETTLDQLLPLLYDELRDMAHRRLAAEGRNPSLDTTALVHEAYLRLVDGDRVARKGRAYFFGAASRAMRRVLVDRARRRRAQKRGGDRERVSLGDVDPEVDTFAAELLDLDAALEDLEEMEARQARVVECRFFAGMTVDETADALDVSARTVKYDWAMARAWLHRRLAPTGSDAPTSNGTP